MYLERCRLALAKIAAHMLTFDFWRQVSLVGKRIISISKLAFYLPFPINPLFYALHFIRAFLRIINYWRNTQNKNLGETRKLLFSIFKVLIAAGALISFLFVPSIPAWLLTAFLIYSLIKLVDSTGVLVVSIVAHSNIDKQLPENNYRRAQYWDNIIKHTSILAIGVAMTLLTAIVLSGGVAAVVWISPVMLLSLAIASVVTVAALAYFATLVYQYLQSKTPEEKGDYRKRIIKFSKILALWLLCLVLVSLPFLIPPTAAIITTACLLGLFNVYDIAKSSWDYGNKIKVPDPEPSLSISNANSINNVSKGCYYGARNPLFSLVKDKSVDLDKTNDYSQNKPLHSLNMVKTNHITLIKESFLYIKELKNKLRVLEKGNRLRRSIEKSKLEAKIEYVLYGLAKTLKNKKSDGEYLISLLMEVKKDFDQEVDKLAAKPLHLNTIENINNVNGFKKDLDELTEYFYNFAGSEDQISPKVNNILLDLFHIYMDAEELNKDKQPPNIFHQSFFYNKGRATLFWQTFEYCQETQQKEKRKQKPLTKLVNDTQLLKNDQVQNDSFSPTL